MYCGNVYLFYCYEYFLLLRYNVKIIHLFQQKFLVEKKNSPAKNYLKCANKKIMEILSK